MQRPIITIGGVIVAASLISVPVHAQEVNPESLRPPESVRLGSLQQRRPGRLIQAAIGRHRDFANQAFRDRSPGEPVAEDEADPTFFQAVLIDVLEAFFQRIQLALFGSQALDDLSGTLDDLFSDDQTADEATDEQPEVPSDELTGDPSDELPEEVQDVLDESLLKAFRSRHRP